MATPATNKKKVLVTETFSATGMAMLKERSDVETLTFPNAYHTAPYVTATAISNIGLYASSETPTALTAIIHVWDHTGADVGGICNWTANGT